MNKVVLVLVIAVVAVAVARPQNAGRPTLFNRPNRPGAVLIPQGSGSASGAGTANVGASGISVSGAAITSAQEGGVAQATGQGTGTVNVVSGETSAAAGGIGESAGK